MSINGKKGPSLIVPATSPIVDQSSTIIEIGNVPWRIWNSPAAFSKPSRQALETFVGIHDRWLHALSREVDELRNVAKIAVDALGRQSEEHGRQIDALMERLVRLAEILEESSHGQD